LEFSKPKKKVYFRNLSEFSDGRPESIDSDYIEFNVKDIIDYGSKYYLKEDVLERYDEDGELIILTEKQGLENFNP